jgi:N-acetylglutamate synthase-like GNAT family acetyltransferase
MDRWERVIVERINAMETPNVVPFKTHRGISSDLLERLLETGKKYRLSAIYPFNIEKIVVAQWVHLKCRYGIMLLE